MPVKLAKIGAGKLSEKEILICGGIYEDTKSKGNFTLISNTYKLHLDKGKWIKSSKMKNK
jgi:hypothetical protein